MYATSLCMDIDGATYGSSRTHAWLCSHAYTSLISCLLLLTCTPCSTRPGVDGTSTNCGRFSSSSVLYAGFARSVSGWPSTSAADPRLFAGLDVYAGPVRRAPPPAVDSHEDDAEPAEPVRPACMPIWASTAEVNMPPAAHRRGAAAVVFGAVCARRWRRCRAARRQPWC
jgi:hypothetical protein